MDGRRKIRAVLVSLLVCLLAGTMTVQADSNHEIEQVFINMPDVTAYYRTVGEDTNVSAYLDGEALTLESNQLFSETGEAVEYYVLLDISASIRKERFENIKSSLTDFLNGLREQDKMALLTFGNETQTRLNGDENRADAANVIAQLNNDNQNTVFFDAINTVTDMISQAAGQSQMRRVVVIISDGKDCSDNTRNMDSVESNLTANGIPVYTIAVENNEGDTETVIADYQGKFSNLASSTGGQPWTAQSTETSVLEGLQTMQNTILGSYRAGFKAATNIVSNKTEEFVLNFNDAASSTDTYSVMVSRNQSDTTVPTAAIAEGEKANELVITYSEAVQNADVLSNYVLKQEDTTIPTKQLVKDSDTTYRLLFDEDLYNGDYSLEISNVTDISNEKNALENPSLSVTVVNGREEEKETIWDIILKWWPLVLTALVVILGVLIALIVRFLHKKKGLTVVNGEVIDGDQVKEQLHIVPEQSGRDQKNITLWMSSGSAQAKRIDYTLDGSAIVGRSSQCDIYCDDPMMSRQHFVLELDGGNIFVSDLETRNGTSVNGVTINGKYKLAPYDEIVAGNIRFRIEW